MFKIPTLFLWLNEMNLILLPCSYDHSLQAYLPNDRQWIRQRMLNHLRKLAH
ncbi:putative enhancer of rudimentary [Helianthus annuus]|nr:putative enhancer of rudimentary [Helianthus annuus]